MSESVRIENYPFASDHIVKLCTFREVFTQAGVQEEDLSKCITGLTVCDNFDDVFKLIKSGNFDQLVALTILYIMQGHDDEAIKAMIDTYPDSLIELELARKQTSRIPEELALFRGIIREALVLEEAGIDEQRRRRFFNRENPDDDIDNTVEMESKGLEIRSLEGQERDNRAFDKETAKIISSFRKEDKGAH